MNKKNISVISFVLALMMCIMCVPNAMASDGVPTIAQMIPSDGATNVQTVGTVIQLKFTEELDQKKVESNGSIDINNGARILAVKLADPKSVNVYITDLKANTEYKLKVTSAIASISGVPIETVEKKFTTGPAPMYHQIPEGASDMSDPIWIKGYTDAGANGTAIKFVKDGDNDVLEFKAGWADAPLLYSVSAEPDVTYIAKARVKSDRAQAMRVVMLYTTESQPNEGYRLGTQYDQQVPAGEWVEISSVFKMPSDLSFTRVHQVYITSRIQGSKVLVDDFQFYEENSDEPAPIMELSGAGSDKLVTMIEDDTKEAVSQKLEGLGIYSKNEFEENDIVTREVFSKYMAKILDSQYVKSTANFENYTDVDVGYDGHIGTMLEMNILTPNDNGEVRPNDAITFSEICRAFVVALGHQKALEDKAPIVAASNLGIRNLTGLYASSEVRYKDLNGLLDSFLNANCLYDEFGKYKTDNVLHTKLGITKLTGIVEATSQTSINSANGIRTGYVTISGNTYKLIDTDVSEVLGKRVTYYVKKIDDEDCVVFIGNIDGNNKILKLNAYDVLDYTGNVYSYLEENKESTRRAELESGKIVIYNGRTTGTFSATDLLPTYGWVELIDNDQNGKYDVVKITDYDTYVVESYDPTTEIIRDKFENKFVDLSKADELLVFKNGKKAKASGIKTGDIVTVEQSMDKCRIVLNISTNVLEGSIGAVKTDDSRGTIIISFNDPIHGTEVQKDYLCVKNYTGIANTTIGTEGTFYIDAFGQIAAFLKGRGSWTYGYIKKAKIRRREDVVRIELFTENNTHETIDCAQRVTIDSYKTANTQDTFDVLASAGASTSEVEPELIMYKTNNEGLIRHIKTARGTSTTNDFRLVRNISNGLYISGTSMITANGWGDVYVGDDTLLLQVPADSNISDMAQFSFRKAKGSLLYKGTDYTVYGQSSNSLTADLLVVKDKIVWNQDARYQGIVTGFKTKLGEDDEIITVVTTTQGVLEINETSSVDINNMTANNGTTGLLLKKGDYIGWRKRADGFISDMQIVFKGDTKTNMQGTSGIYALHAIKCFYGKVSAKEGDIIAIKNADGDESVFNANKTTVYRVNSDMSEIEKVSVNEISAVLGTAVAAFSDWENTVNCLVIYQ